MWDGKQSPHWQMVSKCGNTPLVTNKFKHIYSSPASRILYREGMVGKKKKRYSSAPNQVWKGKRLCQEKQVDDHHYTWWHTHPYYTTILHSNSQQVVEETVRVALTILFAFMHLSSQFAHPCESWIDLDSALLVHYIASAKEQLWHTKSCMKWIWTLIMIPLSENKTQSILTFAL